MNAEEFEKKINDPDAPEQVKKAARYYAFCKEAEREGDPALAATLAALAAFTVIGREAEFLLVVATAAAKMNNELSGGR